MTVILLRHGRSTANTSRTLAGRPPGAGLDAVGRAQADALCPRLDGLPVEAVVRSPLMRCRETVEPPLDRLGLDAEVDDGLVEVDYGSWTGRALSELAEEKIWSVVQQHPSWPTSADGDPLAQTASRAVSAGRRHDQRRAAAAGRAGVGVGGRHGAVINASRAGAYAMHRDHFQPRRVQPSSVSVVRYPPHRAFV